MFSRYLRVSILLMCLALNGCSVFWGDQGVFRNREKDYLHSGTIKEISIPEQMQSQPLDPLFVVPKIEAADEFGDSLAMDEYEVPRPQALDGEKGDVAVKIQKLGDDRWIFLNASTAQVWPQTQSFLSEYKIGVINSVPAEGLIETDWVHFKADTQTKSRYRITIEKGIHAETSEVHVVQVQFPVGENPGSEFSWPKQSMDTQREAWLVDELAAVLAESVDNSAASLMGQNVGKVEKAQFAMDQGEPALKLRLPFLRGWASLLHASNQKGFTRWEENRDPNIIYMGIDKKVLDDEDDGGSLFGWLAFWRDDDEVRSTAKYPLSEILTHLEQSPEVIARFGQGTAVAYGKELKGAQGYLVVVSNKAGYVTAVVRDNRGKKLPAAKAKKILRKIRGNLI